MASLDDAMVSFGHDEDWTSPVFLFIVWTELDWCDYVVRVSVGLINQVDTKIWISLETLKLV